MSGVEGLAAVSLAGNILQFVHTTRQLVSTTREVFETGTKEEHVELELIAKELQSQAGRLRTPTNVVDGSATTGVDSLPTLAAKCQAVADQLLGMLAKLQVKNDGSRWKSFLQVLRTQWHETEIDALRARLNQIGKAVR
jgi:hypothetical protein